MSIDFKVPEKCPRCGGTEFTERSTGPDERYLAFDCKKCELVYSRWADEWYLSQEEDEEYAPETPATKQICVRCGLGKHDGECDTGKVAHCYVSPHCHYLTERRCICLCAQCQKAKAKDH